MQHHPFIAHLPCHLFRCRHQHPAQSLTLTVGVGADLPHLDIASVQRVENQRSGQCFPVQQADMIICLVAGKVLILQVQSKRMTEHQVAQGIGLGLERVGGGVGYNLHKNDILSENFKLLWEATDVPMDYAAHFQRPGHKMQYAGRSEPVDGEICEGGKFYA